MWPTSLGLRCPAQPLCTLLAAVVFMVLCAALLHMAPPAEKLGSELSDGELWSESPCVRFLQALPSEQVEIEEAQKKGKRLEFITQILFLFPRNC